MRKNERLIQILNFINTELNNNQWATFYGNCGQTWQDLHDDEDTSEIVQDHITVYGSPYMNSETHEWLRGHCDKLTIVEKKLKYHFFI